LDEDIFQFLFSINHEKIRFNKEKSLDYKEIRNIMRGNKDSSIIPFDDGLYLSKTKNLQSKLVLPVTSTSEYLNSITTILVNLKESSNNSVLYRNYFTMSVLNNLMVKESYERFDYYLQELEKFSIKVSEN
jgi:hypothetical protein